MTRRVLAFCSLGIFCAAGLLAQPATRELKLGTAAGSQGQVISVDLSLTSDSQVQGLVAAADWDPAKLRGTGLTPAAALAAADVVVPRIENAYFVLGVVMDADGADTEIIPPGTATVLATLKVEALGPSGAAEENVDLVFQDGKYNTKDLGPRLDNIIVVGGLSIGKVEGLVLTNGRVTLTPPPPGDLTISETSGLLGACVRVPIVMGNSTEVQGFVTAITHPAGVTLNTIVIGPAAQSADFSQPEIFANGGTFGVVMELDGTPPFNTIPPGANNVVAFYEYCSPVPGSLAECQPRDVPLTFADNVLGNPVKENLLVVAGRSLTPGLHNGTLHLAPDLTKPPCGIVDGANPEFGVGSCELVDDPNSDDKDLHIPGTVRVSRGTAERPSRFQLGLFYKSPEDDEPDEGNQTDHIQGVSMAVCFDPKCILCDETFTIAGTITEAVGAEFVNVHCENDTTDGDPGELIVGILVDALPPFDGQELPPTNDFLKLICVDFHVNPTASCTDCARTPVTFCDGADGRGRVPIRNLISVMNESIQPTLRHGEVQLQNNPVFIRGDCNGSDQGPIAVDIADAASVISFLFLTGTWKFHPPCIDACDANDDGRVDLADSVFILRYLFKFDRDPKPPFPEPGVDPTDDKLSCGSTACPTV